MSGRIKVVIYARVSTSHQELDHQIESCRKLCDLKGLEILDIFQDIGSGRSFSRPNFQIMLHRIRDGHYGGVVAFKLDRLGRRALDMIHLVKELKDRGIEIFTVYDNFDTTTALGRFAQQMFILLSELEAEDISEKTKQRLAALKASGKKLGRKPLPPQRIKKIIKLRAAGLSVRDIHEKTGVSIGKISEIIKGGTNHD